MKFKKLTWPFIFYFVFFAGVAAHGPYRVLFYQTLSFTGAQIGLLVGIAPLISLVSLPLLTGLADRLKAHRLIMSLSMLLVIAGLILFPYLRTFPLMLGVAILFGIFFSPVMALSNSSAMFMLGDKKELFGRVRLGGTIGFSIAATLAGALVENQGLKVAFWAGAGLLFISFLTSLKMEHGPEESEEVAEKGRVSELLKNPHFLLFLLIGLSGGISFSTINTYLFPYMEVLGAGESAMGLALTIGTIAEIPIMFFADRFIKRFKTYGVLVFSLAMTGVRFLLLAVAPHPTFVLFVQLLNGFNYPLLMVAGVIYANEHAPQGFRASAQGLFNTAMGGVGSAIGGFAGGLLFEAMGAKGMYLVFFLFVAIVLVLVSLIHRVLPPEKETVMEKGLVT